MVILFGDFFFTIIRKFDPFVMNIIIFCFVLRIAIFTFFSFLFFF